MGATNFYEVSEGKNAAEAFTNATSDAGYEVGHGGYTGTIAEKGSFHIIENPLRISARKFIEQVERFLDGKKCKYPKYQSVFERAAHIYDDKWGPALCIPVKGKELKEYKQKYGLAGTHKKVYIFCGLASE